jgi:hypothetical protein
MDTHDRFKPEIGQQYYVWGSIETDRDRLERISEETVLVRNYGEELDEDYYNSGNCWETER